MKVNSVTTRYTRFFEYKVKDKNGSVIFVTQGKNGKIIIPFANTYFTLSKEDAEKVSLYDIEDFDVDAYKKAYGVNE